MTKSESKMLKVFCDTVYQLHGIDYLEFLIDEDPAYFIFKKNFKSIDFNEFNDYIFGYVCNYRKHQKK